MAERYNLLLPMRRAENQKCVVLRECEGLVLDLGASSAEIGAKVKCSLRRLQLAPSN